MALLRRVILLVGLGLLGASSGDDESVAAPPPDPAGAATTGEETPFGPCRRLPPEGPVVEWVPGDLPLPAGTFPVKSSIEERFRQALFVVPMDYQEFLRFAVGQWPEAGYILGPGETKVGEVEDSFLNGQKYGQFRARDTCCDGRFSELLLVSPKSPRALPPPCHPSPPSPSPDDPNVVGWVALSAARTTTFGPYSRRKRRARRYCSRTTTAVMASMAREMADA